METGVRIYNVEPLMEKGHLGKGEIKYNSYKIWQQNKVELIDQSQIMKSTLNVKLD